MLAGSVIYYVMIIDIVYIHCQLHITIKPYSYLMWGCFSKNLEVHIL